ncbi:MAG TPA: glycosyltransferase, partial [Candidatus Acidoferrum sp.]|nr:glycosyltransferase [Candidatus Acidoferrum sp.]
MALYCAVFLGSAAHDARALAMIVACVPLAYYVAATLAAVRFFRREREKNPAAFTPPISILKPVHGVDFASYENFQSFCRQDYPEYEILFCVNDLDDPAVPLIRRLIAEYPERNIQLLSKAPHLGSNRKINNLALLAREAKYELLVQSDGDVRVGPNYLREIAAPFAKAETAVVS